MSFRQTVETVVMAIAAASMTGLSAISALASPAPAVPATTPASTSPRTEFACTRLDTTWATVVRRGNTQVRPMINWTTNLGGFSPEQRCTIVSSRLNRAVAYNGGKLAGLMLTSSRLNRVKVICYVRGTNEGCTNDNILFTLRPGDDPDLILRGFVNVTVNATSSPIQQTNGITYLMLGEVVESLLSGESCAVNDGGIQTSTPANRCPAQTNGSGASPNSSR